MLSSLSKPDVRFSFDGAVKWCAIVWQCCNVLMLFSTYSSLNSSLNYVLHQRLHQRSNKHKSEVCGNSAEALSNGAVLRSGENPKGWFHFANIWRHCVYLVDPCLSMSFNFTQRRQSSIHAHRHPHSTHSLKGGCLVFNRAAHVLGWGLSGAVSAVRQI